VRQAARRSPAACRRDWFVPLQRGDFPVSLCTKKHRRLAALAAMIHDRMTASQHRLPAFDLPQHYW
jgi:hypothetical protein